MPGSHPRADQRLKRQRQAADCRGHRACYGSSGCHASGNRCDGWKLSAVRWGERCPLFAHLKNCWRSESRRRSKPTPGPIRLSKKSALSGMRLPPATAMTSRKLRRHLPSGQRRLAAGLHPRRPQPIVAALIPSCLFVATRFHLGGLSKLKTCCHKIQRNRPQATRQRLSQKHK